MFKDSFVNLRTVVGRLLTVATVISLTACSTPYSTANHYDRPKNLVDLAYNIGKSSYYSVPNKDKERHTRCAYFAVDTLQAGEECKWASSDSSAKGTVMVAGIKPNGCHVLFNTLTYKNKSNSWQEIACKQNNNWKFYRQ